MSTVQIRQFRAGLDNYNYLIYDSATKNAIAIDPLEAHLVLTEANRLDLKIKKILNTHGHPDHTAGNAGVQFETNAKILAGEKEDIASVDEKLNENSRVELDGISLRILFTPGHTMGHICVVVNDLYLLTGDTLFLAGCGNCRFGGDPDLLFESLEKLKKLPDHLKIFCGHEYARKNLAFCLREDPQNDAVKKRQVWIEEILRRGGIPVTTLAEEKEHNIFLRSTKDAFKRLREARNTF